MIAVPECRPRPPESDLSTHSVPSREERRTVRHGGVERSEERRKRGLITPEAGGHDDERDSRPAPRPAPPHDRGYPDDRSDMRRFAKSGWSTR
jgi:hypothetical protein